MIIYFISFLVDCDDQMQLLYFAVVFLLYPFGKPALHDSLTLKARKSSPLKSTKRNCDRAKRFLGEEVGKVHDHLAVMILFAHRIPAAYEDHNLRYLHCALKSLQQFVLITTPLHVYIWVHAGSTSLILNWLEFNDIRSTLNVMVMPISEDEWNIPDFIGPKAGWSMTNFFDEDYYAMGRWRLTHMFDFVHEMGYEYMLQMDDDTIIMSPCAFNIVEHFRNNSKLMGVRNKVQTEGSPAVTGLPEMTK